MLSSLDTAPRTRDERESTRDVATPRRPQCDTRSHAEMEPALRVLLHLRVDNTVRPFAPRCVRPECVYPAPG